VAKKGTLVVRFIGDTKEFDQANKKMGTGLSKTGKAIDSSLTKPLGEAGTASAQLGKDFAASGKKIDSALSGTKSKIDSSLVQPLKKTETAVKGLGGNMSTEMGKFDSAVGGSRQSLQQFQRDLDEIKKTKIAPEIDESEVDSGLSSLSGKLKGGLAGLGAAAGVALVGGIMSGMDAEASGDRLAASLGLSPKKSKQAGAIAGRLYAGAYGESLQEVNDAVGAVISSLPGMRNASNKAVESATAKALDFAAVFDVDVARAAQVAGQAVRTGLAKDATNAFDLLVSSAQRVPAAVREDLIDAADEYGPFFRTIGLTGQETFSMLVKGAQKGMYGIDKTGDAIKEFTILATDGSDATQSAFEALGMNADRTSNLIAGGGEMARIAFNEIIDGLLKIKNPAEQSQAALKLFGTPLEDLNVSEVPKFLKGLDATANSLGKVDGASARMGKTLADNAQTNLTSFTRQLKTGFVNVIGGTVIPKLKEFSAWLSQHVGPAISDMVESFKKNWPEIKATVVPVLNDIGGAIKDFVTLARKVWDKWGDDITRVAKVTFQGMADTIRGPLKVVRGIIQTITALIEGDWSEVWNGIKQILSGVWDTFKSIIVTRLKVLKEIISSEWDAVKDIFKRAWDKIKELVGDALNAIKNHYTNAFETWKRLFSGVWEKIKGIVTGAAGGIKDFLVRMFTETIPGVFTRAWNGIKGIFKSAWSTINKFVREGIAEVVDKFLDFVGWMLDAADKAFGWIPGVGEKLHNASEDFKRFKEDVNQQIRGIDSTREIRLETIAGKKFQALIDSGAGHPAWTGNRATGGAIEGGKRGRDSVPIMAMPGEHVWTASEVRNVGGHGKMKQLRSMANQGALQPMAKGGPVERQKGVYPELHGEQAMVSKFAKAKKSINKFMSQVVMFIDASQLFPAGQIGAALKWAKSQVGKPYSWGGVGPGGYDCSGFMSAITNVLRGKPPHSRVGSTADFPWAGFVQGADPRGFTIGSTPSYPGSSLGHMAGTLGGVNVESSGGVGVRVGKGARGFNDSGFTEVYHLAGIKGGMRLRGGDTGALAKGEKYIIRHEAGGLFNVNANNPISSAFGLGQLIEANRVKYARQLGFNAGMERGDTGTTNRDHQIAMMRAYIRDRYGSLSNAVSYHKRHGVYDNGGILPPGITIAHNNTGRNERVVRPGKSRLVAVPTTINIGDYQFKEEIRILIREEVADEFAYQAGM
jgi:phage-related minor tail protein